MATVKFAGPNAPNGIVAQVAYGVKEGIFAKHHINLEISYPSTGVSELLPLLANGTYDLSIQEPASMMTAYQDGVKTVAVFAEDEASADGITMEASSGIKTLKQLEGKTLGYPTGSTSNVETSTVLKRAGVDPSKVKFVALSFASLESALISHRIDGIVAFAYAYDALLQAQGIKNSDFLFKNYGINDISGVFAAGATWAKQNPTVVKNLDAALQESTEAALAHPEQAAKDLIATAPASSPSLSATMAQWTNNKPYLKSSATASEPYGYMSLSDWQASLEYAKEYDGFKGQVDLSSLYTNQYLG
jgi:NitT/TauT family transport system substrate-binding protein